MKYTIFGNCGIQPYHDHIADGMRNDWGVVFNRKHEGDIKWYMNSDQSNMQIATQVMLFSKPDTINIVGMSFLTRIPFIDIESPRSYDIMTKSFGDSCFADKKLTYDKNNGDYETSTWQSSLSVLQFDKHKGYYQRFNRDKDEQAVEAYFKRHYLPQSRWELFMALALISKHGKATGHDIRIIPRRWKDFDIAKMSKLNKIHLDDISKHIDHDKIFWYIDPEGKKVGHTYWPKDQIEHIVSEHLQPWLDKDI